MKLFRKVIIFFLALCIKVLTLENANQKEGEENKENSNINFLRNLNIDTDKIIKSSYNQSKITETYELKSSFYSKVNKNKL
jgi:hypothetical protein